MKKYFAGIILISGIALGITLLFFRMQSLNTIEHDDGISYLSATGNQGFYATNIPSGKWVHAYDWQRYWEPNKFGSFKTIGQDLALYDIHPPMYFWLLHVWVHIAGVKLGLGPAINIVLHFFTVIVIFLVCKQLRCSSYVCASASVLWLLSSSSLSAAMYTRQYSFLAFSVASLCFSLIFFLRNKSLSGLILTYFCALIGLLVHYHFIIVLGFSIVMAAAILFCSRNWRALVSLAASVATAVLTFVVLHPLFISSFNKQQHQAQSFNLDDLSYRATKCLDSVLHLIIPSRYATFISDLVVSPLGLFFIILIIAGFAAILLIPKARNHLIIENFFSFNWFPLVISSFTLLSIWSLYIFHFTPRHAMGPRYIMIVSPILFIVLAQLLDRLLKLRIFPPLLLILLISYQAIVGGYTTYRQVQSAMRQEFPKILKTDTPIILDSIARGVLPRILWHVKENTLVYAATQSELIDHFPCIPKESPVILYINTRSYGNTSENRLKILKYLEKIGYRIQKLRGGVFGVYDHVGEIYELELGTIK
jgi:hypothetical protein